MEIATNVVIAIVTAIEDRNLNSNRHGNRNFSSNSKSKFNRKRSF